MCSNAIYLAFFNYIGEKLINQGMKATEKKTLLEETLNNHLQMFSTFVHSEEEQLNAIYQTALSFSKHETLRNVFHIMVQLFYTKEIFNGRNILMWLENSKKNVPVSPVQEHSDDEESEEEELEKIDQPILEKFLLDVSTVAF